MIYLQKEKEQFAQVKKEFDDAYKALLEQAYLTFEGKGTVRDTGSPIHHRMSPLNMLSLIQAKGRRIESTLSLEGWGERGASRARIVEECTDIANYALFIAALATMLEKEVAK